MTTRLIFYHSPTEKVTDVLLVFVQNLVFRTQRNIKQSFKRLQENLDDGVAAQRTTWLNILILQLQLLRRWISFIKRYKSTIAEEKSYLRCSIEIDKRNPNLC